MKPILIVFFDDSPHSREVRSMLNSTGKMYNDNESIEDHLNPLRLYRLPVIVDTDGWVYEGHNDCMGFLRRILRIQAGV